MKHLGDITKLDGAKLPPVDIICGGSPCQDLSVAGLRKGIEEGDRSSLFFEQIRVIKEMREHERAVGRTDEFCRPRYMVFENVPGLFSSGAEKGEDFRIVLEETAKIADPNAHVPKPNGKWSKAGCIMGNGYSIAWKLTNAMYYGTPQRRQRVCLLADFCGSSAPWILFDPKLERTAENGEPISLVRYPGNRSAENKGEGTFCEGLPRDFEQSKSAWQGTSEGTKRRIETASRTAIPIEGNGSRPSHRGDGYGKIDEPSFTLNAVERHSVCESPIEAVSIENHPNDSRVKIREDGTVQTLSSRMGTGGNNTPMVLYKTDKQIGESYTLKIRGGKEFDGNGRRAGKGALIQKELSGTLGVSQDQTLIQNVSDFDGDDLEM